MSNILVVMDEGTSRVGDREASLKGLGPKNKGTQYMGMENQREKNHWIWLVLMLLLIKIGIMLRATRRGNQCSI